jgi:hypothetical protein
MDSTSALAERPLGGVIGVYVDLVEITRESGEGGHIGLGDGPSGGEDFKAGRKFFEIFSAGSVVLHGRLLQSVVSHEF